jgi:hypothetical protein
MSNLQRAVRIDTNTMRPTLLGRAHYSKLKREKVPGTARQMGITSRHQARVALTTMQSVDGDSRRVEQVFVPWT